MELPINKIIRGDCLEVLKTFPKNCIDTIITDPPYELGFMGKSWDKSGRDFIGIEKEKEYCKIAEERLKATPAPLL